MSSSLPQPLATQPQPGNVAPHFPVLTQYRIMGLQANDLDRNGLRRLMGTSILLLPLSANMTQLEEAIRADLNDHPSQIRSRILELPLRHPHNMNKVDKVIVYLDVGQAPKKGNYDKQIVYMSQFNT